MVNFMAANGVLFISREAGHYGIIQNIFLEKGIQLIGRPIK